MNLEIDKIRREGIVEFLANNPMVAIFEWYDLLDSRQQWAARRGNQYPVSGTWRHNSGVTLSPKS